MVIPISESSTTKLGPAPWNIVAFVNSQLCAAMSWFCNDKSLYWDFEEIKIHLCLSHRWPTAHQFLHAVIIVVNVSSGYFFFIYWNISCCNLLFSEIRKNIFHLHLISAHFLYLQVSDILQINNCVSITTGRSHTQNIKLKFLLLHPTPTCLLVVEKTAVTSAQITRRACWFDKLRLLHVMLAYHIKVTSPQMRW